MQDAAGVGEIDREAQLRKSGQQSPSRKPRSGPRVARHHERDRVFERDPPNPLHREKRVSSRDHPEVVHRNDARMFELPLHAGLAHEALQGLDVFARVSAHDLHGDVSTDDVIVAELDLAHPADAEGLLERVSLRPARVLRDRLVDRHLMRRRKRVLHGVCDHGSEGIVVFTIEHDRGARGGDRGSHDAGRGCDERGVERADLGGAELGRAGLGALHQGRGLIVMLGANRRCHATSSSEPIAVRRTRGDFVCASWHPCVAYPRRPCRYQEN